MRKITALVIAMVMIVSTMSISAFAADPVFNTTSDKPISVTGLEKDDAVRFYQIFEYDQNATTTGGWKKVAPFTALTDDQVNQILGLGDYATGKSKVDEAGISAELAGIIGKLITSETAVKYPATADATGKAEVATPDAGLYVALITAAKAGTVYNPVFVGADYYTQDPESKTWSVSADMTYADESMAKKSTITTSKTAKDDKTVDTEKTAYDSESQTVSVGDVLTFTVDTTIPEFGDNYVNAAFEVKDTLDTGLQLLNKTEEDAASTESYSMVLKIKSKAADTEDTDDADYTEIKATDTFTYTDASGDHTVSPFTVTAASATGYTITFNKDYLLHVIDANTDLQIIYKAKVLDTVAASSVNEIDNTVVVSFSNNPTDSSSRGKEIAKTHHYTFNIDGNLLGGNGGPWKTTEVVKVGLDKDGNEITVENATLHEGQTSYGPLAGAKFKLYKANGNAKGDQYTNDILTADTYIGSGADGRLNIYKTSDDSLVCEGIKGLDAGVYMLEETEAPAGYIRHQDLVKIEIIPTFQDKEETITDGTDTLKVTTKELVSYVVKIDGNETANYTITNAADGSATGSTPGDDVTADDEAGKITSSSTNGEETYDKITNTQGVELPSTGGIGTTLFYVIGAILVLGAGILLVTRRRMNAN